MLGVKFEFVAYSDGRVHGLYSPWHTI